MIAVDASGGAGLEARPDHHGVARHRYRETELVTRPGITGFEIGLLRPHTGAAGVHVGCTCIASRIARLVAVDASGVAGLPRRSDHHGVARHRYRPAEPVIRPGITGFEIGLLRPHTGAAGVHVGRTCIGSGIARLVAVHTSVGAVLLVRSDHHGVARHRYRVAELVTGPGITGFEIGLLRPHTGAAGVHVGRTCSASGIARLVAVHTSGGAGLPRRSDHHGVARHRHRVAKLVTRPGITGFEIGLLGDGVDGERIACAALVDAQAQLLSTSGFKTRGQHFAIGVPHFQAAVVQHRRTGGIAEGHAKCTRQHLRLQTATGIEGEGQRHIASGRLRIHGWPLRNAKAVLKAALVVDPPFLHIAIPLIAQPLAGGLHCRRTAYALLVIAKAVALQFQAPGPAGVLRLRDKAALIKRRQPLLARVARAIAAFRSVEGVPPSFVGRANARPVGLSQAFGHLLCSSQLLGLPRLR